MRPLKLDPQPTPDRLARWDGVPVFSAGMVRRPEGGSRAFLCETSGTKLRAPNFVAVDVIGRREAWVEVVPEADTGQGILTVVALLAGHCGI